MLKGALQWSVYPPPPPQWTESIYRRLWRPLQSGPCMLVLILPTSEGYKVEWTLAGKKVTQTDIQPSTRPGIEPQDLRNGRQRPYRCAEPSATSRLLTWQTETKRFISAKKTPFHTCHECISYSLKKHRRKNKLHEHGFGIVTTILLEYDICWLWQHL